MNRAIADAIIIFVISLLAEKELEEE